MYFSGFAIPPEDGLQAAAAGGLRAAPPEVLNASSYDQNAKLSIKKAQKHNEKLLIRPEKTDRDLQNSMHKSVNVRRAI
jgi:hypothetical protein